MAVRKKKVAKKKATTALAPRRRGRPPGVKDTLPRGMVKALKIYSGLPPEALEHPKVKAAVKVIEDIMLGKHANRHGRPESSAQREIFAGKPKARHEHDTGPTLAQMLEEAGKRK